MKFSAGQLKSSPRGSDTSIGPLNNFCDTFGEGVEYIGVNEKDIYKNEHEWNESTMFML